jgi:hypothetical protein
MAGSEAVRTATGSPRSRTSSNCRRIMAVSTPRRRCVGWTETIVTPATPSWEPPGTVIRKLKAPAVETRSPSSQPAMVRSSSATLRHWARSSPDSGGLLKARSSRA